jgi:hypothetical protein
VTLWIRCWTPALWKARLISKMSSRLSSTKSKTGDGVIARGTGFSTETLVPLKHKHIGLIPQKRQPRQLFGHSRWQRLDIGRSVRHCSVVLKRLAHALTILTLMTAIGGHWAVLQSVAWTSMLAQNLRSNSLSQAVQRTFDGEHPCVICKSIAQAKQSEKRAEFTPELQKLEFSFTPTSFAFFPPSHFYQVESPNLSLGVRVQAPPVPPPKPFRG